MSTCLEMEKVPPHTIHLAVEGSPISHLMVVVRSTGWISAQAGVSVQDAIAFLLSVFMFVIRLLQFCR